MNSVLGWNFHIHKPDHNSVHIHKDGFINYKIFRKQCILQEYIHPKLYNIDAENDSKRVTACGAVSCVKVRPPYYGIIRQH